MFISTYVLSMLFLILGLLQHKFNILFIINGITVLAFLPKVVSLIEEPQILNWDYKAMENIAQYITITGRTPPPFDGIFRIEYVSYPVAFILQAILSEVTGLSTSVIMAYPTITIALYIILISVILTFSRYDFMKKSEKIVTILLLLSLTHILKFMIEPFIYQNYGRIMLLLAIFVLAKLINRESNLADMRLIITLAMISIAILFAHSESSLATFIVMIGLIISIATAYIMRLEVSRIDVRILFFICIVIIQFLLYHIWWQYEFAGRLLRMTEVIIRSLISPEPGEVGLSKFTPLDYTQFELYTFFLAWLSIAIIAFYSFIKMSMILVLARRVQLFIGPLVVAAGSFAILLFFSPYKSDIAFKFTTVLFYTIVFSLYEVALTRFSKNINSVTLRKIFSIILIALSLVAFWGFSLNSYRFHFSEFRDKGISYAYILDEINLVHLINLSKTLNLLIVDTPRLPYYYIRDYLAPRLPITYYVLPVEPHNLEYDYRLINGLYMPRFILFTQMDSKRVEIDEKGALVVSDVNTVAELSENLILNIDGELSLAYRN
jgi:hypothetical protein